MQNLKVYVSGFKDYVQVVKVQQNQDDEILLSISNGEVVELHCPLPGSEVRNNGSHIYDRKDVFLLGMEKGMLFLCSAGYSGTQNNYVWIPTFNDWSKFDPLELKHFSRKFPAIKKHHVKFNHYKTN